MIGINLLYEFLKLQHSMFVGTVNPSQLGEWMRELDKIFKTMMCPEEYRVGLVSIYSLEKRFIGGILSSRLMRRKK